VEGDAERLPIESGSVDLFTIAFGIRNVTHVDAAVAEAFRVLKPGGRFMCLEFSQVENPLLRQAYDTVRVVLGGWESGRWGRRGCRLFAAFHSASLTRAHSYRALHASLRQPTTPPTPHVQYSFNVIPALGQLVANDRSSYQYLVESIRKFPDQEAFAAMIRAAGFRHVSYHNFTFGVCAVHSGFKV
jgi:ubiquinone/menaquinone biosynthesis C-methylase UbiE